MTKRMKAASVLFLAASSVYALGALAAKPQSAESLLAEANHDAAPQFLPAETFSTSEVVVAAPAAGTNVKVLEANEDPFAAAPTSQPSDEEPSNEGESVTADNVNVSDEGSVEIHVNDAQLVEVLRMLSIQSQKNIVASKDVGGKVTANLYGVTVRESLDAILHANGFAYREKGNFIYVYTAKEIAEMEKAERVTQTEIFRLFYTPAANAANMIKPVLSDSAQVSLNTPSEIGIETGTGETGGNAHATEDVLVVTDYPENLEKARKVLKEIDRRPQQIMIEATILRAALSEDNALGVDFNVLAGVDFQSVITNTLGQVIGGDVGDNVTPQASSIGTGNSFTSGVNGGFKVGVVCDSISVFLAALEGVTDTTVLANPKVLALNKQKGEVIVGRKDGYLTTTSTETSTIQTVEFLDTGTRLIFRPFIGDDGFVRMEIHPEDSSGGLTADNLPFKITTEVTSNVMVRDGNTIVIGGLFREASDSSRSQVPGVGNIPLAGLLFRNQRDRTVREEIIILLTPHIIKDEKAYSEASETELAELDQLRVGVRKGMMPWGRERLAESEYEKAVEEMNKPAPDREKALFYLDSATNLNPKFREAIMMKQEITGRQLSTADNSSIRTFISRRVLAEKDTATPTTLPASVPITITPRDSSPIRQTVPAVMPTKHEPSSEPSTQPTMVKVDEESADASKTEGDAAGQDWKTWLQSATAAAKPEGTEGSETPAVPSTSPAVVVLPSDEPAVPSTSPAVVVLPSDELAVPATLPAVVALPSNEPETPATSNEPAMVVPVALTEPATQPTSQPTVVELPTTELPAPATEVPAEPAPADPSGPNRK